MNQDLETYLRDPVHENNGDYTSLLRQAMDEVLRLSASAVEPLESEIESEYRNARTDAQDRFNRDKERIERQLRLDTQAVRKAYETLVKETEPNMKVVSAR